MSEIKKHLDLVTESEPSVDPFALENLRIDPDFAEGAGVRKIINTIPVRRPNPQEFIRVHSSAAFRLNVAVIDLKDERETFLVLPKIAAMIPGEYSMVTAYACINRQGVVFIWPVKLPNPDGRLMAWHTSAAEAAEMAMTRWVRIKANLSLGAYEAAILGYCAEDVDALRRLFLAMAPRLDWGRALLRGRYMAAAARMEHAGIPIDVPMLDTLRCYWELIQGKLIARIDKDYEVFEGRTFKQERFEAWLARAGVPWPRLPSGRLDLGDGTFRQMSRIHRAVSPLRELRSSLSDLRLNDLAVGSDGRNRTVLSAFRARTGRNQPSNSRYVFGPSVWIRSLIKPPEGWAVAYIDYEQQEFAIAAKLSGDPNMQGAYASGDPYLSFAKQANAIPADATKASHGHTRELFKVCALAVLYGMEAHGLALKIDQPDIVARDLLRAHHEVFRQFWKWSDAVVDHAKLTGSLHTVFGWTLHGCCGANPRMLRNFEMQANGAEMLRLACCLSTERGVEVCGPVHDALVVAASLDEIDHAVAAARAAMAEASRVVLAGFEVRTDGKIIRYPDRFTDPRGTRMWNVVMQLIAEAKAERAVA
jgi:DNA polymerase-1